MASEPITVLIADDEEDMRTLARIYLSRAGVEVIAEAIDGSEALDAVRRFEPPPVPTVLVLDNRMPGMSGLEVAQLVLEQVPQQPIVLFSAFLTPEIEQHASAVGIRACLSKSEVARLPEVIAALAGE
ncbi:MAG: two-component system, NarL family, nitrate/nitrite response regulator NarL [Actinomycetota bacterium]|jgi:CheY-like chemotaxis protein